jgi:hypothetical protein
MLLLPTRACFADFGVRIGDAIEISWEHGAAVTRCLGGPLTL